MFLTSDHEILGLNPTGGGIQVMTVPHSFHYHPFIVSTWQKKCKKDVKHLIIIILGTERVISPESVSLPLFLLLGPSCSKHR